MSTRVLLPLAVLLIAGCGGEVETEEADDVVPPGAIPAAPDARPGAPEPGVDVQPGAGAADTAAPTIGGAGPVGGEPAAVDTAGR